MAVKTEISVNGIWASTSYTATIDDPCKDHTANFGFKNDEGPEDCTEEVYDALLRAWESRPDGEDSVIVSVHGDTIELSVTAG